MTPCFFYPRGHQENFITRLNYIVDVVKFGSSRIPMKKVTIISILQGFEK